MTTLEQDVEELDGILTTLETTFSGRVDQAVETLIAVYRQAGGEIKLVSEAYEPVRTRVKKIVEEIMVETGQTSFKTKAGQIYVTNPSSKIVYDPVALDALCASDDDLARRLRPHRREEQRAGTMTIR